MPRSYLDFSGFDRAFDTGVQLGTQVVRERIQRQQKLEDDARQVQNERDAEDYRAKLQVQTNAAEEANAAQARAQQRLADASNPVLNRSRALNENIASEAKNIQEQNARNGVVLDPKNASFFSNAARNLASQSIQKNAAKLAGLYNLPSTTDFTKVVPPIDSSLMSDPQNEVTTLPPESLYSPQYQAKLQADADYAQGRAAKESAPKDSTNSKFLGIASKFSAANRGMYDYNIPSALFSSPNYQLPAPKYDDNPNSGLPAVPVNDKNTDALRAYASAYDTWQKEVPRYNNARMAWQKVAAPFIAAAAGGAYGADVANAIKIGQSIPKYHGFANFEDWPNFMTDLSAQTDPVAKDAYSALQKYSFSYYGMPDQGTQNQNTQGNTQSSTQSNTDDGGAQ